MSQQSTAESAAETARAPPRSDDGKACAEFGIRSQAFILTYQRRVYEDELRRLPVFEWIREWSWSTEMAGREHTHFFVVLEEKPQSLPLSDFRIEGAGLPNVSPSSSRGRSARRGWDRAHFYCFVPYKSSHVDSGTNYRPGRDYAVETSWITTLWRQGKLDAVIEAAAEYRCLTPYLEAMVSRTAESLRDSKRRAMLRRREASLALTQMDFQTIPLVVRWAEQFDVTRYRYQFLWLSGASGLGKTMYAKSLGRDPWLHSAGVNWVGFDPLVHDVVIFDDVYDQEEYINKNKPIFQSARATTVNTSKTNCYALTVDTAGVKIVICNNEAPRGRWILTNCLHHEVTERLWVAQHAITDVGDAE